MKSVAQRQAEFRERARKVHKRDRLDIKLPSSSLSALGRLAKHRGEYKWVVLASLIDDAARQLPGNTTQPTTHGNAECKVRSAQQTCLLI